MRDEDLELLELYRLEQVDAARRAVVERRLAEDPLWAATLEELEEDARLGDELVASLGDTGGGAVGGRPEVEGVTVRGEIFKGGQGAVYHAVCDTTGRDLALKVLLGGAFAGERQRLRFEREVEIASRFDHPNLVPIYGSGRTSDGQPYLLMPLIRGDRIDLHVQPSDEVRATLRLFARLLDGVHYAHQRGVIHRDLKPGNILVDERGEPRVLDFGLARSVDAGAEGPTLSGEFAGTLAYASPEQVGGEPVDVRSDVYSLGVILYRLLTGRSPYPIDGSVHEVVRGIAELTPARFSRDVPHDGDLELITQKALAKEPERRYASAAHFAEDLRRFLAGHPVEAHADSGTYILRKMIARHRVAALCIAATLLILAASTVVSTLSWRRAEIARAATARALTEVDEQRDAAEEALERAHYERETRDLVSRFVWNLMSTTRDDEGGHEVTVVEALRDIAGRVDQEFLGNPLALSVVHEQLGASFFHLGLREEAERHLHLARDRLLECDQVRTGDRLRAGKSLAVLALSLGRLAEAEKGLREYVDWARQHPELTEERVVLGARVDLGFVLHKSGRVEEAMRDVDAACREAHGRFGADDYDTLRWRRKRCELLLESQRLVECREEASAILALVAERHPDKVREQVSARNLIALCAQGERDLATAARLYDENLAAIDEHLPPYEELRLVTLNNLAGCLSSLGRRTEAIAQFERALAELRRWRGDDHPRTLAARANLGRELFAAGRVADGESTLRAAADGAVHALGAAHHDTLNAINTLAWRIASLPGRLEEAERMLGGAVDAAELAGAGRDEWMIPYMRANRGHFLMRLGRHDEGERELVEGHAELVRILGADNVRSRGVAKVLAAMYEKRGDDARAAMYR